jgi:hypothetical protein
MVLIFFHVYCIKDSRSRKELNGIIIKIVLYYLADSYHLLKYKSEDFNITYEKYNRN